MDLILLEARWYRCYIISYPRRPCVGSLMLESWCDLTGQNEVPMHKWFPFLIQSPLKGPFLIQSHPKDSLTQSFPRVHSLPYTITSRVFLPDPVTSKAPSSNYLMVSLWFPHGWVASLYPMDRDVGKAWAKIYKAGCRLWSLRHAKSVAQRCTGQTAGGGWGGGGERTYTFLMQSSGILRSLAILPISCPCSSLAPRTLPPPPSCHLSWSERISLIFFQISHSSMQ